MECLNSASVAAMVARVASLGYCSNGGELQERFARTCCHSCRDFGRIFGQAFKPLPCVVVERISGWGRACGQSKAERHDQERGNEPLRRGQALGVGIHFSIRLISSFIDLSLLRLFDSQIHFGLRLRWINCTANPERDRSCGIVCRQVRSSNCYPQSHGCMCRPDCHGSCIHNSG